MNTDDIPKHLKLAVNVQYEMLKNSKLCWLSKIQKVYNNAGLSCKFSSAGTESTMQHVNEVMTRLSDQFIQDWFVRINKPEGKKRSNKLRMYKLFKENFQLEYYLKAVATVKYRRALKGYELAVIAWLSKLVGIKTIISAYKSKTLYFM